MPNNTEVTIPRRKFLQTAVGALGATALGFGPMAAIAKLAAPKTITIAYWDGSHLVPALHLPYGDSTIQLARLSIRGYNSVGGTIRALDTNFVVASGTGMKKAPFTAWIAPPVGTDSSRFLQHVDLRSGIVLNVQRKDATGDSMTPLALYGCYGAVSKLRVGHYVLLDGTVDVNQFSFHPQNHEAPLSRVLGQGAIQQYIVIEVEKM